MKFERDSQGHLHKKPLVKPPQWAGYKPGDNVKILFGHVKCKFLTPYPKEVEVALTVDYPGYIHTPAYKANEWDGKKHFITRAGYFPTGLLPVVFAILRTGIHPLDKDADKVLRILPKSTDICVPKDIDYYHPGFLYRYIEDFDVLEGLKDGEFAFPVSYLNGWKQVEDTNPLAKSVLRLAKDLYEK